MASLDEERAGRWSWPDRYALLHHLLLAATIASVTLVLEQTSVFTPLDLVTRGLMSYVQAWKDERAREATIARGYQPAWDPEAAGDRPRVIIVRQFPAQAAEAWMHPAEFAATLIRAAAEQEPAVLAVGLELDPALDDPRLNDPSCGYPLLPAHGAAPIFPARPSPPPRLSTPAPPDPCDGPPGSMPVGLVLKARADLRQALEDAARTTALVVTAPPLPLTIGQFERALDSDDRGRHVLLRRLAWTLDICGIPGVRVAFRFLQPRDALTFVRNTPSLGNLAWQAARSPRPKDGVQLVQFTASPADGCSAFRERPGIRLLSEPAGARDLIEKLASVVRHPGVGSVGTLSSRYYETLAHGISADVRSLRQGEPVGRMIPRDLRNQVVFLGEEWPPVRLLHLDDIPEIDREAAVYYSNLHGAVGLKHAAVFALDVLLGTLLGGLLAWSWAAYGRARMRMDAVSAASLRALVVKAPLYLRARAVLASNLLLVAGLVVVMFAAANFFLRHDVWINPLPLVVGMSIKGLLASRHLDAGHELRGWWAFYNRHPDVLWQLPVIVISIALAWYWGS